MPDKAYVVTPVYNGERFLRETLDSVQAQTWRNLEHIVIENASTDTTPQILAEYADARVPVRVIKNETLLPQTANWNKAIASIPEDADWFRVICADDTMAPDYMERCIGAGQQDDTIGIVTCQVHTGNGIHHSAWSPADTVLDGEDALRRFLTHRGSVLAPHLLYRRSVITEGQPFFDDTVSAFDTDAVLRTLCSWKLGIVHAPLANRRVHEDSVTMREISPKQLQLFNWYHFMHRYGPRVLSRAQNNKLRRQFRRHYLWRLLRASVLNRSSAVWKDHSHRLKALGEAPTLKDAFDVALDRILIATRLREGWNKYPW